MAKTRKKKSMRRTVKRRRTVAKKRKSSRKRSASTAASLRARLIKMANERLTRGLFLRDKAKTAKSNNKAKRMIAAARRELRRYE